MQGQLLQRPLTGTISTSCGCCGEPMQIDFDPELNFQSQQPNEPIVSTPMVDIPKLKAPNIIDDF